MKNAFKILLAVGVPFALQAQVDFKIDGRDVQVHGFISQGYADSDHNNFLTMDTSHGSFNFTDGAVNVSSQISDKFRVGAQAYVRSIGELGHGHLELDWAQGDYKFKDWFGVRAGKVKTPLGLFNDSQDLEFLHTWAVLPQSLYPLDLRSLTIAHIGGDAYGDVTLRRAGSLSYTVYAGVLPIDKTSGTYYNVQDQGGSIIRYDGNVKGLDAHWNTPVDGLKVGISFLDEQYHLDDAAAPGVIAHVTADPEHITSTYADFVHGKWHLNGEYRNNQHIAKVVTGVAPAYTTDAGSSGFFVAAAYRVSKHLELGGYNSRFYVNKTFLPQSAANHIFDQTITARFDVNRFWNFKVEGHFMDGYADIYSAHGFYARDNPTLKPTTNLLVIRTGLNF